MGLHVLAVAGVGLLMLAVLNDKFPPMPDVPDVRFRQNYSEKNIA